MSNVNTSQDLPVSVVIPAYNRDWCIAEAIESVRSQTAKPSEIIVVDDGSTDKTAEVAESMGATVIRQANKKLPGARNTGIRAAGQPWIAFLDTDDIWLPDKLERQWAALQLCPDVGLCFTDIARFNANGTYLPSIFETNDRYKTMERSYVAPQVAYCSRETLADHYVNGHFVLLGSNLLVRRELLFLVGLFDESLLSWEDYDMMLRLLLTSDAVVVERPLWRQRMHQGNYANEHLLLPTGEAMVGERILAQPGRYPSCAVAFFQQRHVANLNRLGVLLLASGRAREAADWFAKSRHMRPSLKTTLSLLLARVSSGRASGAFNTLRRLWRKRSKFPILSRIKLVRHKR